MFGKEKLDLRYMLDEQNLVREMLDELEALWLTQGLPCFNLWIWHGPCKSRCWNRNLARGAGHRKVSPQSL